MYQKTTAAASSIDCQVQLLYALVGRKIEPACLQTRTNRALCFAKDFFFFFSFFVGGFFQP